MNFVEIGKTFDNSEDLFPKDYFNSKCLPDTGCKCSDFEIIKLLGKGGFGKVYKVKYKLNKQIYAMKIFDKNIESVADSIKNFKDKLIHPNIIKIYTYFEENNKLFLIMEYMNNGNLKDFINMNSNIKLYNSLTENQKYRFLLHITWPLYEIHSKLGLILRNIKPENILIDDNFNVKFGEFFSTLINNNQDKNEKHPYECVNDESIKPVWARTKKYMSTKLKGPSADVYSLGKVLNELLSNDLSGGEMQTIIYNMCLENNNAEDKDNYFRLIADLYIKAQNNTSIDATVLSLKSLQKLSNLIMEKEPNGNIVLDKVIEILKFINNREGNFFHWNYYVNELRLNLTKEINNLEEELDEIDPNLVYLYLINIIINEAKKDYYKSNNFLGYHLLNNEIKKEKKEEKEKEEEIKTDPNKESEYKYIIQNDFIECPIIKEISGLMRTKIKCTRCELIKYQFNNYVLLELDLKTIKKVNKEEKMNFDQVLKLLIEQYTENAQREPLKKNLPCNRCLKNTEHNCFKEIYSLPDSLVISIKENTIYDNNISFTINDEIELDLDKTTNNNNKKYELVALLKCSKKTNNTIFYSFGKFNNKWFLAQRYKGVEPIEMNDYHRRSRNVRMIFYQAKS